MGGVTPGDENESTRVLFRGILKRIARRGERTFSPHKHVLMCYKGSKEKTGPSREKVRRGDDILVLQDYRLSLWVPYICSGRNQGKEELTSIWQVGLQNDLETRERRRKEGRVWLPSVVLDHRGEVMEKKVGSAQIKHSGETLGEETLAMAQLKKASKKRANGCDLRRLATSREWQKRDQLSKPQARG